MTTSQKMIINKLRRTNHFHLEKSFLRLKENLIYGQRLASIGSWTHDIQQDEIFLSDEVYDILGCSPQLFDGKLENFYLYVHPDDLEEVRETLQGVYGGKEYELEYRIITLAGTEKYILEKTKVLPDMYGEPAKIIGIMQDITKRKLLEKDLKAFGQNLNLAQKVAGVGSWKYDVINDVFFRSEEVYNIYGIDPLDLKKDYHGVLELIHPADRLRVQDTIDKCLKGKSYQIEYRIPQFDGTERFVLTNGEPIFAEDQSVVGIIGTMQDITEKKLLENKLIKNYQNLARAQALAHIGSWEMDVALGKNFWSEEAYRIFGIEPEQYDGTYQSFLNYVHPEDRWKIQNILENPPEEHCFEMEFRIIRADGFVREVYQVTEITFGKAGKPILINGTIQDITDKKELQRRIDQNQAKIHKLQKRFEGLVQNSCDVFQITASDGTIQYISPAVEKIAGYKPEELMGKNVFEIFEGKEKQKILRMLDSVINNTEKSVQGEVSAKTKSGKIFHAEIFISNQLEEPSIRGIIINWRDITERIENQREINYISTHDALTKLPNQHGLKKHIIYKCQDAKQKGYSFALIMLDIDGYEYISQAIGYQLAEKLISQVTRRLKTFLGTDKFLARNSKNQFVVTVTASHNNREGFESLARGILDLFSQSFKVEKFELFVAVNLGISIYLEDGEEIVSLEKNANIALFRSKNQGKNRFRFYSQDMDFESHKQFELRNDLPKALKKGQLRVYYQPQVNLHTNIITGAEALIRWDHPTWGLVAPDEFIPIAEETGFILDLGKWILREVCSNYKQWQQNGLPQIKVSINYSSIQLYETDFVANILNIIDEFDLDPNFLIIEIIESVIVNNFEQVIAEIKKLQAFGIQVALDDFGTGFSSLNYLNKFAIDILKVDRSFIHNIPHDKTSTIIAKTIINLARELNIGLIAEGIETLEQLSCLCNLNCSIGQGYLYNKPVPGEVFERLLVNKKCKPDIMA